MPSVHPIDTAASALLASHPLDAILCALARALEARAADLPFAALPPDPAAALRTDARALRGVVGRLESVGLGDDMG